MLYLLGFVIVIWAVLAALRFRLCWIHASLVYLTSQLVGTYNLGVEYRSQFPTLVCGLGCAAFIAGLAAARFLVREVHLDHAVLRDSSRTRLWIWLFGAITTLLIGYHYVVGGIPLFQPDILVARFENASSGLLGIPGRFNLFGGFFLYFIAASYAQLTGSTKAKWLVGASFGLLSFSLFLGGSKGNLMQAGVAAVVCAPFTVQFKRLNDRLWQKVKGLQVWQMAMYGGLAAAGFCVIAMVHIARGNHLYESVSESLIKRTTEVSGQALYVAIARVAPDYGFGYGQYFLDDLRFFFSRLGLGEGPGYSTVQLVSATVTGRHVLGNLYLVPQTINAFGYLYLEGGVFGVLFGSLGLGYFSAWLYLTTERTRTCLSRTLSYFLQMLLFWLLSKGNFGYYIPNMLIMAAVFVLLLMVLDVLLSLVYPRTLAVRAPAAFPVHQFR